MNYCLIDESDPEDFLECEGNVLKTFFHSSRLFNEKKNLDLIWQNKNIERCLKARDDNYFNIVHFSAHGNYTIPKKALELDYSMIVRRRFNHKDIEIFRPDSIVRTGLKADLFFSTNCETFNPHFIDIVKNYQGISNFIAPVNSPKIGNTLIFAMMFYNLLFKKTRDYSNKFSDTVIESSFKDTNLSYRLYRKSDDFRLYNFKQDRIIKY